MLLFKVLEQCICSKTVLPGHAPANFTRAQACMGLDTTLVCRSRDRENSLKNFMLAISHKILQGICTFLKENYSVLVTLTL